MIFLKVLLWISCGYVGNAGVERSETGALSTYPQAFAAAWVLAGVL